MSNELEISTTARKHGVADADIRHAIEHYAYTAELEQRDSAVRRVLYLGPDRAANLLEVVTLARDDGTELVIHAMKMRRSLETLLSDS